MLTHHPRTTLRAGDAQRLLGLHQQIEQELVQLVELGATTAASVKVFMCDSEEEFEVIASIQRGSSCVVANLDPVPTRGAS